MAKRSYCFTLNNYTEDDETRIQAIVCRYLIYGRETGESGTPHLQGYIEFKNAVRPSTINRKLGGRAHTEARRGSPSQAADYCKKDGDYFEKGSISQQGRRTDLVSLYQRVKEGKTDSEILEELPGTFLKYSKAVTTARCVLAAASGSRFQPVEVNVFWGEPGSGKTRACMEADPDLFWVPNTSPVWWDGYCGQETILLDDFYGWIKYGRLLNLLDGYRFRLPVKGGFTWKAWKRVYITSNMHPDSWYQTVQDKRALNRRISSITRLDLPMDEN